MNKQNTIFQSTDLTFVATCLLADKNIQLISVDQNHRGIKVFLLSPIELIEKLQLKYSRGEVLLSPLALANQIRQLKMWSVSERSYHG